MTDLHLDYETKSEIDLRARGLDVYSSDPSTEILMLSWAFDNDPVKLWTPDDEWPSELTDAMLDPNVRKWAFNAQFERIITRRVRKIKTPLKGWRCTMALAYMHSFTGGLEQVGEQMGLAQDRVKIKDGKRLIKMFCVPQKVTKNQPFRWRDALTDPEEWEIFCRYCVRDTESERHVKNTLIRFPIPDDEWWLYEFDQLVNDRGLPIDLTFARHAYDMVRRRKAELTSDLRELTGLANPNSPVQLTEWLKDRGYPFDDLKKDTVKKVLAENEEAARTVREFFEMTPDGPHQWREEGQPFLLPEAEKALKLRQQVARTSVEKYKTLMEIVGDDSTMRFGYQFAGAGRTNRWAGRKFQQHNLMRTPKWLEQPKGLGIQLLDEVTETIRQGDFDSLNLWTGEPMDALAGCMRSVIRVKDQKNEEFRVCDLASIETRVVGGVSECDRLLNVFAEGKDPYIDFGQFLYSKPYEEVTKLERQDSKPAVLGCGFGLGGGDLHNGKRTGLWGYAESMGVNLPLEECHRAVGVYRSVYSEVPQTWWDLEAKIVYTIRTGRKTRVGPLTIELMKPYLTIQLPSGRRIFYKGPRVRTETRISKAGNEYDKDVISYMGQEQKTRQWKRLESRGAKFFENVVQAIARDVLKECMIRLHRDGFTIRGHVHDEIICVQRKGDNYYTVERMKELMSEPMPWWPVLPLAADGYSATFYRK